MFVFEGQPGKDLCDRQLGVTRRDVLRVGGAGMLGLTLAPMLQLKGQAEELGKGGMATVYLAEDIRHGRKVAIKVLDPELSQTIARERFLREGTLAAAINHPVTCISSRGRLWYSQRSAAR